MKTNIRILHLEDSPRDAEIIRDRLEAEGLVCDIVRVQDRAGFESALAAGGFDVILCDYNLTDYDGISALQAARQKHPLTPVLLISGSLGEEAAVKSLQEGATDYLLKQKLERLPSAVKRALSEADEHRQRAELEAKLRESEERFRLLADHSAEGFWFATLNPYRAVYLSPAVEKIWGMTIDRFYQDPNAWLAAIHAEDQARVRQVWEAFLQGHSSHFDVEYRVVRPDGSIRWVMDSGTPVMNESGEIIRLGGIVRDMTERKQIEMQALRTQRLESLGTLAGGVAHDVNNALAPILMATELLRMSFPNEAGEYVQLIHDSAKRAADIMKQLLTYAKGAEGERILLPSRHLFKDMEKMIRGSFPKHIKLSIDCAKDLQTILGDPTQLGQVLLNLCVNARDAMPTGGTLTLKAEQVKIDALYASAIAGAKPGNYVVWSVTDTGTGIPPAILDRIFDPFFSTKGPDKGTGLGLSTVAGIVKGHGGFLRVYSTPGQGTTFIIYLPAATADLSDTTLLGKEKITFRGNGETILVVDDEMAVREISRNVLTALNFKVLVAPDGATALIQAAENQKFLRVVITDMHMAGMDGLAFVRVLKQMLPETKIIVTSGRLDEFETADFKALGVSDMMAKPFTHEKLVKILQTTFTQQTPSESGHTQPKLAI
ncbi:MAG TPA: response regulator [Candidatus Saccharimonadales bacterium]|nr:response regulator [Candidatus Saccharimonadales bacterium]